MSNCVYCSKPVNNNICVDNHPQPLTTFPGTIVPQPPARAKNSRDVLTTVLQGRAPELGVTVFNQAAHDEVLPGKLVDCPDQIPINCSGGTSYHAALSKALAHDPSAIVFMSDGGNNGPAYDDLLQRLKQVHVACIPFGQDIAELSKLASRPEWIIPADKVAGELGRVIARTTMLLSKLDNGQGKRRRIILVLDVSSSMSSWATELEAAYTRTLADMKKLWLLTTKV